MKEDTRRPAPCGTTVASGSKDMPEGWWKEAELIGTWRMAKVLPLDVEEMQALHKRTGLPVETIREGYMAVNRQCLAKWLLAHRTGPSWWQPPMNASLRRYPLTSERSKFVTPDHAATLLGLQLTEVERLAVQKVIPAYWLDRNRFVLYRPDIDCLHAFMEGQGSTAP